VSKVIIPNRETDDGHVKPKAGRFQGGYPVMGVVVAADRIDYCDQAGSAFAMDSHTGGMRREKET